MPVILRPEVRYRTRTRREFFSTYRNCLRKPHHIEPHPDALGLPLYRKLCKGYGPSKAQHLDLRDVLPWEMTSRFFECYPRLTVKFLEDNFPLIDWDSLSRNRNAPLEFLLKYPSYVSWVSVVAWMPYEKFLQHKDRIYSVCFNIHEKISIWVLFLSLFACLIVIDNCSNNYRYEMRILFLCAGLLFSLVFYSTFRQYREDIANSLQHNFSYSDSFANSINKHFHHFMFGAMTFDEFYQREPNFVLGRIFLQWKDDVPTTILRKFLTTHTTEELFTHPAMWGTFPMTAYDYGRFFVCDVDLPLSFYEKHFADAWSYLHLNPRFSERFWYDNWQCIPAYRIEEFLKYCPNISLNFVTSQWDLLIKKLWSLGASREEAITRIVQAMAQNPMPLQNAYERFEPLFQRAKRNFLHRYYCPRAKLGTERLQREYNCLVKN